MAQIQMLVSIQAMELTYPFMQLLTKNTCEPRDMEGQGKRYWIQFSIPGQRQSARGLLEFGFDEAML
jgi:hypothetical protein